MTVLAGAIGVGDAQIVVNATLTVGNYPAPYTIGSENIAVTGGSGSTVLSVLRGQNGTAAASHLVGVAITSGWYASSGGSVTANQQAALDATPSLSAGDRVAALSDVAGGPLTVIGPLHVDHTAVGINVGTVDLGSALPDGCFVIAAWALFPVGWKSNTNADCDFKIDLHSNFEFDTRTLKEYAAPGTGDFALIEPFITAAVHTHSHDHDHTIPAGTDSGGGTSGGAQPSGTLATGSPLPSSIVWANYAAWSDAWGDTVTSIKIAVEVYANSGASITAGEADIYALLVTPS